MEPAHRLLAGPLAQSLAASSLTPGLFAGLPPERRLAELLAASEAASREAGSRADSALAAGLPDESLEAAAPLLEQLAGPLSLYVSEETSRRAAEAYPALKERLRLAREEGLLSKALQTAQALAPKVEPPHMRVRRAERPRETERLAREFESGLRRSTDPEARREYVNGLWEVAEAAPSRWAHRAAARALIRELGRERPEAHRLLVLRAMRVLGDRTPYEEVERRLLRAALREESSSPRERVAREAELTAESVASLSPFTSVRRLALRHYQKAAEWTGDDERRKELERRVARLKAPVTGYWPAWKPRPPTLWERARAGLKALLPQRRP